MSGFQLVWKLDEKLIEQKNKAFVVDIFVGKLAES